MINSKLLFALGDVMEFLNHIIHPDDPTAHVVISHDLLELEYKNDQTMSEIIELIDDIADWESVQLILGNLIDAERLTFTDEFDSNYQTDIMNPDLTCGAIIQDYVKNYELFHVPTHISIIFKVGDPENGLYYPCLLELSLSDRQEIANSINSFEHNIENNDKINEIIAIISSLDLDFNSLASRLRKENLSEADYRIKTLSSSTLLYNIMANTKVNTISLVIKELEKRIIFAEA